jgi:hypothetical protein
MDRHAPRHNFVDDFCLLGWAVIVYFVVEHYIDSHGNSGTDTCAQTQLRGRGVFAQAIKQLSFIWWSSIA